ncbi:MAG TPA: FkbM family methyltransferase [Gemmataceae bacterium]|jgi:FkbM family methyltransferase|nr:FkbM family methyltransferase [Gemmataceae bacterium]
MVLKIPIKNFALRYMPEAILQQVRRSHYARKLMSATPEAEMAVLRHLTPPGGCAIDLGANFGLYTRFFAAAVGSDGVVHAVEPVSPMYDVLRSNVNRLGLSQVRTHPVAVSDATRTVNMVIPRYTSGGSNFYEARIARKSSRGMKSIRVPGIRLDDLFARLPRIDVVKCDVEGHELNVLRGAETILHRHRPAWLLEISGNPDDTSSSAAEVVDLMRSEGYEIYHFDGHRVEPRERGMRAVNYFFLRPEHLGRLPQEMKVMTSGPTVLV